MAEFLEGSKAPMANQKRVYKTIIKIYNALPFYKNNSYDAIIDPLIYKQLSPESAKLFQPIIASGRDGVFGTKKQIDTLVRELETINVNKLVQDYEKLPAAAKLPKN